jgi:Restriction endonuclease BsobI
MSLPKHIKVVSDLVTAASDTKAGFLLQAKTKVEKAERYVDAVESLKKKIAGYSTPDELFRQAPDSVVDEIVAASGYSDKACKYFTKKELREAARGTANKAHRQWPDRWKERLASKYLLTRGDSLGGEMRNWIGAQAGKELAERLSLSLKRRNVAPEILADSRSGKIRTIKWKNRRLVFDRKSPLVSKNIDVILFSDEDCGAEEDKPREQMLLGDRRRYLACGELKGGIDKAGADEHYKTANTAAGRIRVAIPKVKTFFVGRAIEAAMAAEIYTALQRGQLDNAANLANVSQVDSLADWLIML